MTEMVITHETSAPPDKVWNVLVDLDNSPQTIGAIKDIERLDGGDEFGVGTKWRETREMFGKDATEVLEVTAVDQGHSYTVEADSRGARYTSVMSVEPAGAGSTISMSFAAEPKGTFSKVLSGTIGKMFEGGTRKALLQDLADIAAAAEAD